MDTIKRILSDFYYATNIAIQFLDDDLNQVDSMGSVQNELPEINTEGLKQHAIEEIVVDDALYYAIVRFHETTQKNGYFLFGPYQDLNFNHLHIPYKPRHLTPHFNDLLVSIVKKNISIDIQSNPHIEKGLKFIDENYHNSINLTQLCDYLNLNMCYFCVLFKEETKMTFSQYLNHKRIEASKEKLENSNDAIIDISMAVGFNNQNHFSATFKKLTGMTPTQYRNQLKK